MIVNVRVADHERFKRNGDDLYLVSDISIAQAALGCEIDVEGIMPRRGRLKGVRPRRRPVRRHRERQ